MQNDIWILAIASLVAISCAMLGVFLILRRMSLLADAISHSILLGIVLAFFLAENRSITAMFTGAIIIGILSSWLSSLIHKYGKVQADASIGIIFTWFFAMGVILVSLYAKQIDIDQECVLYGELAFAPFDTLTYKNIDIGPRSFWMILIVFIINISIFTTAFKRFEIISFHPNLALSLGISVSFWHYLLMSMVSLTTVASFDALGAILVVALLIIPASTAYLLARSLKNMLFIAVFYAQISVFLGYFLAVSINSNIAACIAVMAGVLFFLSVIFKKFVFYKK